MSAGPSILSSLLVWMLGTAALAAPPKSEPSRQATPDAQARALIAAARNAYDTGRFREALTAFTEAYNIKPAPGLLFNIGQCHRQLSEFERAAFFYRRFLDLVPGSPNAPTVRDLLAQVEAKTEQQRRQADTSTTKPVPEAAIPSLANAQNASPQAPTPLWKRGWVWAGVGVVAAATLTTVLIATRPRGANGSLGTVTVP
jgi:tetratricopeptide (TPR) repeat protein